MYGKGVSNRDFLNNCSSKSQEKIPSSQQTEDSILLSSASTTIPASPCINE